MSPENFASLILHECMNDMHKKYNTPDLHMRMKPAKPSEILALQKRVNRKYGHPYLMQRDSL